MSCRIESTTLRQYTGSLPGMTTQLFFFRRTKNITYTSDVIWKLNSAKLIYTVMAKKPKLRTTRAGKNKRSALTIRDRKHTASDNRKADRKSDGEKVTRRNKNYREKTKGEESCEGNEVIETD